MARPSEREATNDDTRREAGSGPVAEPVAARDANAVRARAKPKAARGAPRRVPERRGGRIAVTQANPLALSRQEMGLLTKRLLVLALSDITRDDHDLEPIRITAWEYAQIFNIRGKSIYSRIEESARELLEQTVQVKEANGDWVMFQWVSEARYDSGRDSRDKLACIELKIHEKLKPYLLQLRRDFSIIPTDQLLSFEGFNSMRLFEVLYTASYGGEKPYLHFDVDDLKRRLGLDGKYERFKDFTYVLDRAQQEFARYTCLAFEYEGIKVGRKYQQVDIHIAKNDVFKPRVRLPESIARRVPREADAEARLKALQGRDVLADIGWTLDPDATVKQYGPQRVIDIVRYARSLQRKAEATGRPIFNLPGFVHSLLQQGIEPPATEPESGGEQRLSREAVRSVAASINDSYHQHRRQRAQAAWDALTSEQQELVRTLMQATLHRFTLERIERDGWQGALFEISRLDVMQGHGFLSLPMHLRTVAAYVEHYGVLGEYQPDDRRRVLAELEDDD